MGRKGYDLITYGKPQPKTDESPFLTEIQRAIDNVVRPDERKLMHYWSDVGMRYAIYRVGSHLLFVRAQLFDGGWQAFLDRKVGIGT